MQQLNELEECINLMGGLLLRLLTEVKHKNGFSKDVNVFLWKIVTNTAIDVEFLFVSKVSFRTKCFM